MRIIGNKQGVKITSVHRRDIVAHPHHGTFARINGGEQHPQRQYLITRQYAINQDLDETSTIHHMLGLTVIPDGRADIKLLTDQLTSDMVHHVHINQHRQRRNVMIFITALYAVMKTQACLLIIKIDIYPAVITIEE